MNIYVKCEIEFLLCSKWKFAEEKGGDKLIRFGPKWLFAGFFESLQEFVECSLNSSCAGSCLNWAKTSLSVLSESIGSVSQTARRDFEVMVRYCCTFLAPENWYLGL